MKSDGMRSAAWAAWPLAALIALPATASVDEGRRLFVGEVAIEARLAGHAETLPSIATRCVNCHLADATQQPDRKGYAPSLTAQELTEPRARRGGPPSKFDASAFCRLVRNGIDPAGVLVSTAMPRYAISAAQCANLWDYLRSRP